MTGLDQITYTDQAASQSAQLPINLTAVFYYHLDQRGAVTAITDSEANVVWAGEYFPFGDLVDATVTARFQERQLQSAIVDREISIDLAGEQRDSTLIYMTARHYDSRIGRFYAYDPITWSLEPYVYAANNPYSFIDRFGFQFERLERLSGFASDPYGSSIDLYVENTAAQA